MYIVFFFVDARLNSNIRERKKMLVPITLVETGDRSNIYIRLSHT